MTASAPEPVTTGPRAQLQDAAEAAITKWEAQLAAELTRLFDRQQAVVLARLGGVKARKHTRHWAPAGTRQLEVKGILDKARWLTDAAAALSPVLGRLFAAVYAKVGGKLDPDLVVPAQDDPKFKTAVAAAAASAAQGVDTAVEEVEKYIASEEAANSTMAEIVAGVKALYEARTPTWTKRIAGLSAVGAINQAALFAASDAGSSAKQWLSCRDDKVRPTHRKADGQVRLLDEPFRLGGIPEHPAKSLLMFPGTPEPAVPIDEVINCRCSLLFSPPRAGAGAPALTGAGAKADELALEHKDKVRTPGGAAHYGQPIGTTIVPNAPVVSFSAAPGPGSSPAPPTPRGSLGRVAGHSVVDVSNDPDARALLAKYSPVGQVPDPAKTRMLAIRDHKGRIGAYVVWQTTAGAQPAGTLLAVSVHPKLQGQRIGDQLVAIAAKTDPDIKLPTRPATTAPTASSPAPKLVASTTPVTTGLLPAIASKAQAGDAPGTSGDFDADSARIGRLQKAYLSANGDTTSLFSRHGRWSREREKQQQAVIDHFLNAPGVKSEKKLLVLGGLPGAGKTTTIRSAAGQVAVGVNLADYVSVNADDVKDQMIAMGMVPDYPGLSPEEAATLFHAESFEVAHALMRQAGRAGKNFAYDTSLKSTGQLGFATAAGRGYRVTGVFVDVPVPIAKSRAKARYLAGGRFMPLHLIDGMKARSARRSSLPAENFDAIKRQLDDWYVFDNAGTAPVLAAQGGKGHRARPAAAAATAPAPVAAAPTRPVPVAPDVAAVSVPAALPAPPPGARVYAHPQGKHAYVLPDGSMVVYRPDGKRGTSSATPQKLAAGYGGWTELTPGTVQTSPAKSGQAPPLVAAPTAPLHVSAGAPAPAGSLPVAPMDFNEAPLSDVPRYIADPNYVFQQKVDGIRGVLVVEPGKAPWFASKKGDRLQSSTAAAVTAPMLAKMPATPAGSPAYRVEGEILNGKFHVFDMVVVGQESMPYSTRKAMADSWVDSVKPILPQVSAMQTATTAAEKQALWEKVLASGAEGVMMKRLDAPYNGGQRVSHTLKAKVTATADVVVLERNRGGKDNAVFGMRQNGHMVEIGTVSTGGKDKALGQINVGDVLELEYLGASPGGTLTQPRIVRKRPDKTANDATDVAQLRFVDKSVLAMAAKALRLELEYAVEAELVGVL